MKKIWLLSIILLAVSMWQCKTAIVGEIDTDVVSKSVQSSIEGVADGFDGLATSGQQIVHRVPKAIQYKTTTEKINELFEKMLGNDQAYGATTACLGGGNIDYTEFSWGSSTTSMSRTFNNCKGPFGGISISGSSLITLSDLSGNFPYIVANSKIHRTVNGLRFTKTANGDYLSVSGGLTNGATHSLSIVNLSINGNIQNRNVRMNIDVNRKGHRANGEEVFSHRVYTENPLNINSSFNNSTNELQVRTITGKIYVFDGLNKTRLITDYNNVTWDHEKCLPLAGTAEYEVLGDNAEGKGTIVFSSTGLANFTFTVGDSASQSGTIQLSGCH